jgi:hypothetical protein
MQINGEWLLCDDDVRRPVIRGEVLAASGTWVPAEFLVDTGADRTVFSAGLLALLGGSPTVTDERLSGLGGAAEFATVETVIQLINENGAPVSFRAQYAAATQDESLDMSVLGRDITSLFAAIVDRPGDVVALLGQRHRYRIEQV